MTFRTRFAPSPTGYLHLGHAYSALLAYRAAQTADGVMELRIEDIDITRCRPEFENAILEDLDWIGLTWPMPVRRQSEHFSAYAEQLDRLRDTGLVYRCFKTRKEILEDIARAPHGPGEGPEQRIYRGPAHPMSPDEEAERVERGEAFAWRLSIDRCRDVLGDRLRSLSFIEDGAGPDGQSGTIRVDPDISGDVILARKDTPAAYHLACVTDDALQDITHIIRGHDLFEATHVHCLLQTLLNLPTPTYHHHKLLAGPDGKRYAKRDRSVTLRALRQGGATRADVLKRVGLS